MKNNNVRKFAKEARERLLMNRYDKPQKKVPSGRVFKIANDPRDAMLYNQVVQMAENEDIITNPLGRLIDQALFASLSDTEKLKYVFRLSNKYTNCLEKYRTNQFNSLFQHAMVLYD